MRSTLKVWNVENIGSRETWVVGSTGRFCDVGNRGVLNPSKNVASIPKESLVTLGSVSVTASRMCFQAEGVLAMDSFLFISLPPFLSFVLFLFLSSFFLHSLSLLKQAFPCLSVLALNLPPI